MKQGGVLANRMKTVDNTDHSRTEQTAEDRHRADVVQKESGRFYSVLD